MSAFRGWTQADVDAHQARFKTGGAVVTRPVASKPATRQAGKADGPNGTELACLKLFPGFGFVFEGRRFDICGGATYTPDWVDESSRMAIEVKGEHIHSRDSRRRFDEAKHLNPDWTWIWARLRTKGRKGRRWEIEIYRGVNA